MSKQKKTQQLGMNPSTASGRLNKDILFAFVKEAGHTCFRCGEELTRDTFSIEHKEAWLDSKEPIQLFFDLSNIAYSHLSCNVKASRVPNKVYLTAEEKRLAKNKRNREWWANLSKEEQQRIRQDKYQRNGK